MLRVHGLGLGLGLLVWLGLGAAGCGDSGSPASRAGSFESDVPANEGGARSGGTLATHDASAAAPTLGGAAKSNGAAAQDSAGESAERAIAEADIIQVAGDRLYALSRAAGLAVIDVRKPDALQLLGRYRELPADPFEMYLRDGIAMVMFSGWGQYAKLDSGDYQWVSTSKLLALDVADPSHINVVGSFDVPGSISDSRTVGDVLYVVSHQDGYCWRCEQSKPLTSVVSLDVSDPRQVRSVDHLEYPDGNASWGPRSVTVTAQRMYVAGPEYGSDMPTGSTIQVVDISDPHGDLVQGASVLVKGQISSRWQMDEYNGVLRVISQPPQWWGPNGPSSSVPSVQTFRVVSSNQLDALGQTDLQLPMRETLRSARFDGTRAYAITAEQRDPLFTIDLSDPAHPRQVGELQMPGFVYHMEPRGERLLGLGFDQQNREGAITVSLFDVKDLAHPEMLSRVNFGGSWGSLPEDQDRIQKVFRVLDDVGMILVPFSGWNDRSSTDKGCGYGGYVGGVQIIDFKNDALTGRGAAPAAGETRRALLMQGRLLSVSDEQVQSFNIDNRDQPERVSAVVLARNVYNALQLDGSAVARIGYDSQSGRPSIDFVAADDAGEPNTSYGELDLSSVVGTTGSCPKQLSLGETFVRGSELDVLYTSYDSTGAGRDTYGILVIDASDPKQPKLLSDTHWQGDQKWYQYYGFYSYGSISVSTPTVRSAHSISMLESSSEYDGVRSIEHVRLRVIDLRDPTAVKFSVIPFPDAASYSGLLSYDDMVLTSHFSGDATSGKARFYVDRFDMSDPSAPKQLSSINVPGALLNYDSASARALTTELSRVVVKDTTSDACYQRFAYAEWASYVANRPVTGIAVKAPSAAGASTDSGGATPSEPVDPGPLPQGTCIGYLQRLHLVHLMETGATLEDSIELKEDQQLTAASMGAGVMFATVGKGGYYGRGGAIAIADCFGPCGGPSVVPDPVELLVLGGFASGKFEQGHIRVEDARDPWWGFWGSPPVYAYGQRALLVGQSDVAIIDATKPSAPSLVKRVPLIASVQSVDVRDKTALLTLGAQGVQWLSL